MGITLSIVNAVALPPSFVQKIILQEEQIIKKCVCIGRNKDISILNTRKKRMDLSEHFPLTYLILNEGDCAKHWLVGWLYGFYGISTFVDYLTPITIFYKLFYFKQFSLA